MVHSKPTGPPAHRFRRPRLAPPVHVTRWSLAALTTTATLLLARIRLGEHEVTPPEPPACRQGGLSRYLGATENLRSAARWLLAALAATGGVLIAGLQLSPLGSLSGWRLGVAVLCAVLALTAVGSAIITASRVLTDEWVTLAQLDDEAFAAKLGRQPPSRRTRRRRALLEQLRDKIDEDRECIYRHVADSLPQLHAVQRQANQALRAVYGRGPAQGAAGARAAAWADVVGAAIQEACDCANYHRTRLLFDQLKRRLAVTAVIVAVAALTFAYAANP